MHNMRNSIDNKFLTAMSLGLFLINLAPCVDRHLRAEEHELITGVHTRNEYQVTKHEYSEFIRRLETDHGPYDPSLSEPLLGLGITMKKQGDYSGAAAVFERVLHVTRINSGLHNLDQASILDQVIETNAALEDWKKVNKDYQHLHWLYRRNYDEYDPRLLTAMNKIKGWHLAAINLSTGGSRADHLLFVKELDELAIEIAERQYGEHDLRLIDYLYSLVLTHYYIAVAIQRGGQIGIEMVGNLPLSEQKQSYDEISDQIVGKSYRDGLKLLKRIMDIYTGNYEMTDESKAEAMLLIYIADWRLLFNKHGIALSMYRDAYNKLLALGIHKTTLDDYFSHPTVLPAEKLIINLKIQHDLNTQISDNSALKESVHDHTGSSNHIDEFIAWSDAMPGLRLPSPGADSVVPEPSGRHATAEFDVTVKGLTKKIRIIEYYPENRSTRSQAYETVWSTQFRPRLVGGKATGAADIGMHYYIPEKLR